MPGQKDLRERWGTYHNFNRTPSLRSDYIIASQHPESVGRLTGGKDSWDEYDAGMKDIPSKVDAEIYKQQANISPALAKAIIWNESGGSSKVGSDAGALGIAQFIEPTAKKYGITDRTNVDQSVKGAVSYLNDIASKVDSVVAGYGDPARMPKRPMSKEVRQTLVDKKLPEKERQGWIGAGYNAGEGVMLRRLTDYLEGRKAFVPERGYWETMRYKDRIPKYAEAIKKRKEKSITQLSDLLAKDEVVGGNQMYYSPSSRTSR